MLPLILASVPLALPGAPTSSIKNASNPEASVLTVAQVATTELPTNQPTNPLRDPLPNSYPYVSIQAGVGFPNDLKGQFSLVNFPQIPPVQNRLNLDTGFNGELALGYKFPDFRADLSIGYSNFGSQTQTLTFTNVNGQTLDLATPGKGSVDLFTVMANAYYDFKIKNQDSTLSRWSPYIGAGIGWGSLSTPGCTITNCTTFSGGSASTFVYQGKVGISYQATNSGALFLEGGYLGTTSTTISNVSYDPFGTWRVNLGWRQRFGGSSNSKPVASAPVPLETAPVEPQPAMEPVVDVAEPKPIRGCGESAASSQLISGLRATKRAVRDKLGNQRLAWESGPVIAGQACVDGR